MKRGVGDGVYPGTIAWAYGACEDGAVCVGGVVEELGIDGCVRLHGEVPLCGVAWLFCEVGRCGWFSSCVAAVGCCVWNWASLVMLMWLALMRYEDQAEM